MIMVDCFHCGQAVDRRRALTIVIDNEDRFMCCAGCKSVAKTISDANLTDYYRLREQTLRQRSRLSEMLDFSLFDDPKFQENFVVLDRKGHYQANFIVEPVDCAACVWLIQKHLCNIEGVHAISIDPMSSRMHLRWSAIPLSAIALALAKIGYGITPEKANDALIHSKNAVKQATFAVFVAILCAMQSMMFALPIYLDTEHSMTLETRLFFESATVCFALIAMMVVTKDWVISALSDMRHRILSMNVSVSMAILLLFIASMVNFFNKTGDIYFDSVTMLIAFIALSRWIQVKINDRVENIRADMIVQTLPIVWRYLDDAVTTTGVRIDQIRVGDHLRINAFETLPVDAKLLSDSAVLDEKMRTGESLPVDKFAGQILLAGARNLGDAIDVEVISEPDQSWLGHLRQLLSGISEQKTPMIQKANQIAQWLLPLACIAIVMTFIGWLLMGNLHQAWFSALAVFVIVCPCALALSVPLALSAQQTALLKKGVVVNRLSALEALPNITDIAFDKTGTLTKGALTLREWKNVSSFSDAQVSAWARCLNINSLHPVAQAFYRLSCDQRLSMTFSQHEQHVGKGIEAIWSINGQSHCLRLGAFDFVCEGLSSLTETSLRLINEGDYAVYLSCDRQLMAAFYFEDQLRTGCLEMLLSNQDKTYHILSGDHQHSVDALADEVGIEDRRSRLLPEDKLAIIQSWQQKGKKVMMIGDGMNDSLVMAAADISVSFSDAAHLTKNEADILFIQDNLTAITQLMTSARKTMAVIRQNVTWAIAYHVIMLPLAVLGYITPWLAGIGMAVSSIIVCLNSARLLKGALWKR
jgi:Cu2+-exporting ATPase